MLIETRNAFLSAQLSRYLDIGFFSHHSETVIYPDGRPISYSIGMVGKLLQSFKDKGAGNLNFGLFSAHLDASQKTEFWLTEFLGTFYSSDTQLKSLLSI